MDFDEYQKLATRTALFDNDDKTFQLMYLCLGLAGESGETIEKVKKVIRNHKGAISDETRDDLKKEMGDVLWYLSQISRILDVPFSQVADANIKKLADRMERGVIKSEGDTR